MKKKKKLVVFTGAGVSADSGISTFRDADGLWAKYRIEDVCTPEALERNRETVIDFYNIRRKELLEKKPNAGHIAIAGLEQHFEVDVITQNIDNLHERAGSSRVTHLHGELMKLSSSGNAEIVVEIKEWKQDPQARSTDGCLLRPHVVFFGESVPMFERSAKIAAEADIFIIAGTSLAVYPAASLIRYVGKETPVFVVDPGDPDLGNIRNKTEIYKLNSAEGIPLLANELIERYCK